MLSVSNPSPMKREYPLYNEVKQASEVFREMADKMQNNTKEITLCISRSIDNSERTLLDQNATRKWFSENINKLTIRNEESIKAIEKENKVQRQFYTKIFIYLTILIVCLNCITTYLLVR